MSAMANWSYYWTTLRSLLHPSLHSLTIRILHMMSFFLTSMYVCPIYLPLSSYQWRWPKQWPFPADYLEVVSVAADTVTPLTEVPQDAFRAFINSKITAGQSVLELGDSSISFCQIGSCKTFDIKQASAGPLPFEENTFDVVVISAGLESLLDARGVYRRICDIRQGHW